MKPPYKGPVSVISSDLILHARFTVVTLSKQKCNLFKSNFKNYATNILSHCYSDIG